MVEEERQTRRKMPHSSLGMTPVLLRRGSVKLHVRKCESVDVTLEPGSSLEWEYRVTNYDLDVTVTVALNDGAADARAGHGAGEVAQPTTRVSSSMGLQTGHYTAAGGARTVTLTFDNSFSYYREKDVVYRLFVIGKDGAPGLAAAGGGSGPGGGAADVASAGPGNGGGGVEGEGK